MEDLKQIQEFFSKPLNENVHVEAFKLQKSLKGMGYDVKVKAVDDFGKNVFEIYFNNPADADDDSIFYDVEKLGYDNVRVFANPQESLDEEKVNRKKLSNDLWDRKGYDYKYLNKLSDKKLKSLWDTEFYHESLDEAYIVTYAKSKGEKPASAAYKHRGSALAFMRDLEKDGYITMLTQKPVDGVDESVKENSHFEKRLAKMAADEKEKRAKSPSYAAASKLDVDIEDFFEKGQSYQEFKKRLDKLKEYNSGIYFNPDKTTPRPKVKDAAKSGIEKVKDVLKKIMKEQGLNEEVDQRNADIYAYQFMQYFDKMRRIVGGNFGDDTRKEFERLVQDKFSNHRISENYNPDLDQDDEEVPMPMDDEGRPLEEADINKNLKAIQIQLDQLGVKYEMDPKNKVQPFKTIYKPVNKDDDFYNKFDDIVFRYNLKGVVKTSMNEASKEQESNPDAELKVGDYQTKYFYICPGAKSLYQDIEDKVEDMGLAIRAAKLQDALFAIEASALESGATEAEVFAAQSIADQIMAMAAMMGLDKEHSYIQGHVDKIKGAVGKEQVDEGASSEEKRMAMQAIKRFAKYRGVSEKEAKADLIRAVKELGSIEEAINEIVETIQAGKVLEEKLCKKGEAYRKRRMAAGEKSSAYLSGRAVKVCKGQISGRKKRKKRKSKK